MFTKNRKNIKSPTGKMNVAAVSIALVLVVGGYAIAESTRPRLSSAAYTNANASTATGWTSDGTTTTTNNNVQGADAGFNNIKANLINLGPGQSTNDAGMIFTKPDGSGPIRVFGDGDYINITGGSRGIWFSGGNGIIYLNAAGTKALSFDGTNLLLNGNSQIQGSIQQRIGTSSTYGLVAAVADVQTTVVGNVGAGEDTLMTYTLPASGVAVTGRGVRIYGGGAVANNINAKTIKIYFGSAFQTVTLPVSTAGHWEAHARVIRTGASAQLYTADVTVSNTATNVVSGYYTVQGTLTETETSTIVIKITATATTDNDVTQTMMVTENL